jgi:hypothetical protein
VSVADRLADEPVGTADVIPSRQRPDPGEVAIMVPVARG